MSVHSWSLASAAAFLAVATLSALQPPALPPDPLVKENATVKLAPHTYAIPDGGVGLVPNVGIIVGSRGALVIDPGLGRRNGETVLREMRKVSPSGEVFVTATHFHAEHTTGWVALAPPGRFVSSSIQEGEFTQEGAAQIRTFSQRSPVTAELLQGAVGPKVDFRFDRDYRLDLGGVHVRFLVVGPTHTKGDTVMFVEEDGVLFSGDVVMNNSFLAATAVSSMKAWLAAFDAVEAWRPRVVVPAHGAIGEGGLIAANRAVMQTIQTRARSLKAAGQSADDAAATIQKELQAQHPGWPRVAGILTAARSAYAEAP